MTVESAADISALFSTDDYGEAGTYTPIGGGGTPTVNAILDTGIVNVGFDSEVSEPHDELIFSKASIATPKIGDTWNNGTVYTFRKSLIDDGVVATWLVKSA